MESAAYGLDDRRPRYWAWAASESIGMAAIVMMARHLIIAFPFQRLRRGWYSLPRRTAESGRLLLRRPQVGRRS